jgi:hypothetical protein
MIDSLKTKETFNIDINNLAPNKTTKVFWRCDECNVEKLKRFNEALRGNGLCVGCHRKKCGKMMGDKFGKAQKRTNKCLYCDTLISTQLKTCKEHRKLHLSNIRSGSKNGAWTGKSVCECGGKKSTTAKRCRDCSFKSGERSGQNNGRWEPDKGKIVAARTARGILGNVMALLGKKKTGKTVTVLKYTFVDFRARIESQFEPWMNWENKGNKQGCWSVDHIIPVTVLISCGITDPSIINALWNLRPLCAIKNVQRSNNVDDDAKNLAKQKLNLDLT